MLVRKAVILVLLTGLVSTGCGDDESKSAPVSEEAPGFAQK